MAEPDSDQAWDEYDWERFLQQQDQRTEKYMELLEKYIDDPLRDEIVAREMGWSGVADELSESWNEEEDFEEEPSEEISAGALGSANETFEQHALYQAAFSLTIWIDRLFEGKTTLQNNPAAVKLATHSALAAAKLAAALSDDDGEELGMTIAYLKRSLKATTIALEAAMQLCAEKSLTRQEHAALKRRLFQVRDGTILLMGEFRREWLRRYGSEGFRG